MAYIKEDYVSFEVARLLKEKGFKGCVHAWHNIYDKTNLDFRIAIDAPHLQIPAPTLQMAMKWLREEYEIDIIIFRHIRGKRTTFFDRIEKRTHVEHQSKCNLYLSYEHACDAAIKYCLENLI